MNRYPVVHFMVKHGNILAIVLGLLTLAAGGVGLLLGLGWVGGVLMLGAPLVWLLVQDFVELNQIIADMLLPR